MISFQFSLDLPRIVATRQKREPMDQLATGEASGSSSPILQYAVGFFVDYPRMRAADPEGHPWIRRDDVVCEGGLSRSQAHRP